jgi:hypothetical protein
MIKIALALSLLAWPLQSEDEIGAVYASKGSGVCLLINNKDVKRHATIDLIGGNSRRYLGQAIVEGRVDSCDEGKDDPDLSLYHVRRKKAWLEGEIELVAFLKPILEGVKDSTELRLRGHQQKFDLYQCASSESVHLFVRQKSDHSKIKWHHYISFNFDLEGDCKESDFAGLKEGR